MTAEILRRTPRQAYHIRGAQRPQHTREETTMDTQDNTTGYTQEELDALNAELEGLLQGLEPYSDAWYAATKRHGDEVARR